MSGRRLAVLDGLRHADWLTAERARIYGRMLAVAMALATIGQFGQIAASALHDPRGRPMATDFDAFWSGARLALHGHPADAYDETSIRAAETVGAQPTGKQFLPYLYPPVFLLLSLPIGLLPYLPAMLAFAICFYIPCCLCFRRLLPATWPWSVILGFPAAMMNATLGQSGFVSALAFAAAALLLDTRPILAGAWLGLLAYKPHLAPAIPVALLAARRWRALAACAVSALVLTAASWLVLGTDTWLGFLHAAPVTRAVLLSPSIWSKLLSVYAGIRLLHGDAAAALAGQAVSAAIALTILWRIAARRPGGHAEISAIVAASVLCTPYLLDYDLVSLAIPLAWLAARGDATGWLAWEKTLLATLTLYPLVGRIINVSASLPLGPPLLAALLVLIARRARLEERSQAPRRVGLAATA